MPLSLSNMTPNWKPTMMLHWLSMDRAAQISSWQLKTRSKDLGVFLLRIRRGHQIGRKNIRSRRTQRSRIIVFTSGRSTRITFNDQSSPRSLPNQNHNSHLELLSHPPATSKSQTEEKLPTKIQTHRQRLRPQK